MPFTLSIKGNNKDEEGVGERKPPTKEVGAPLRR
jgi:hypothetical protein